MYKRRTKYGARKLTNASGTFDSTLEYYRFAFLQQALVDGEITRLRRQVPYELIPKQYKEVTVRDKKTNKLVKKIKPELPCNYIADFVYCKKEDNGDWAEIVEDTKGFRTPEYVIKRKLMLQKYGIAIKEVERAAEEI